LRYDMIFFTGGPTIGKLVMKAAAEHLTPVVLELGGKNPVWVDASADLDRVARSLIWSKTSNTGQICLCPDYVLVSEEVKPKLVEALRTTLINMHGADLKKSKDYDGKIINRRHTERLIKLMTSTAGKAVIGGNYESNTCYIGLTVIDGVKPTDPIMQEEIFGPILPLISCPNLDKAIDFINGREKPLAAYCFTTDKKVKDQFIRETSSGGVTINDTMMHFTEQNLPFGGVGTSGMGDYHGSKTFDAFVHHKSVYEQKTPMALLSLREAPLTPTKLNIMLFLLNPSLEARITKVLKMAFVLGLAFAVNKYTNVGKKQQHL